MIGSLASFPLPAAAHTESDPTRTDPLQRTLAERHRIVAPVSCFGDPPRRYIRISAQLYNALPDYERLAGALLTHDARDGPLRRETRSA